MVNITGRNAQSVTERELRTVALESGLELCGVLSRESAEAALGARLPAFTEWQRAGYAGEMNYMQRPPELFSSLEQFLPACRAVVTVALPYYQGPLPEEVLNPKPGYGRVARYAWGRDYHLVLRSRLESFEQLLRKRFSTSLNARIFSDAVPLLERALGQAAQLGFVGKNTLLIRRGVGSFFFLGEILLDIDVVSEPESLSVLKERASCGSCSRCRDVCPTGALVGDRLLDSRRCISYLTIEKRGPLTAQESRQLGSWVFGCDECQEVCPYNHRGIPIASAIEFHSAGGVGPLLDLRQLLAVPSQKAFERAFSGMPLFRAGRSRLLRNALAVIANQQAEELLPDVLRLASKDRNEFVRHAAADALREFMRDADGLDRRRILSILDCGSDTRLLVDR